MLHDVAGCYQGQVHDGQRHGFGVSMQKHCTFEGEWSHDEFRGVGSATGSNVGSLLLSASPSEMAEVFSLRGHWDSVAQLRHPAVVGFRRGMRRLTRNDGRLGPERLTDHGQGRDKSGMSLPEEMQFAMNDLTIAVDNAKSEAQSSRHAAEHAATAAERLAVATARRSTIMSASDKGESIVGVGIRRGDSDAQQQESELLGDGEADGDICSVESFGDMPLQRQATPSPLHGEFDFRRRDARTGSADPHSMKEPPIEALELVCCLMLAWVCWTMYGPICLIICLHGM